MDGSVHPPTASAAEAAAARPGRQRALLCRLGEELAAAHFGRLGFTVLERNVRSRSGEIDLIAFDGRTLVFVEVKSRRLRGGAGRAGPGQQPLSGLRARQWARLRRLATAWLHQRGGARPYAQAIRFDAVGVLVDGRGRLVRFEHLEAAW